MEPHALSVSCQRIHPLGGFDAELWVSDLPRISVGPWLSMRGRLGEIHGRARDCQFSRLSHTHTHQEPLIRSRPSKPNQRKGQNEKFMNFAYFCEFWCFSIGKRARFTLNFCSGMPPWKVHELAFLWFGLPGPLLNLLMGLFLVDCFRGNSQEGKRPIKGFGKTTH